MSFLDGFAGGAAGAGADILQNERQTDVATTAAKSLADYNNDLAIKREQMVEQLKVNTSNQQREAQVSRIDTAAGKIADPKIEAKRGLINSSIADPSSWTPDQQAAVDQSLAADKTAAVADPKTRMQAAIATGDIDPKTAATMGQSAEINQMKMDNILARANDKNATMEQIANIRAEATTAAAQLRVDAANQRAANGKIDNATGRMLITSEDANIKASTSQLQMLNRQLQDIRPLKDGKPNPAYEDLQSQMEDLKSDIDESKKNKAAYLKSMGLLNSPGEEKPAATGKPTADKPASGAPATGNPKNRKEGQIEILQQEFDKSTAALADPKTSDDERARQQQNLTDLTKEFKNLGVTPGGGKAAPAPAGLPAGAKQIGTSGGKPVYETPDGKRFVQK